MAHRGMSKLRKFEKAGLVVLCVAMLATLGVAVPFDDLFGTPEIAGSFSIAGERVELTLPEVGEYGSFLAFQNHLMRGLPPPWKFGMSPYRGIDREFDGYQADDKDLWTLIVLDHVGRKMGVHVPPEVVGDWVRRFPLFRGEDGEFDRTLYLDFIKRAANVWPTPQSFERFVARYLRVNYVVGLYQPLMRPSHDDVYKSWSLRNKRHDAEYVVQAVEELRAEIDPASFTAAEIEEYYEQDKVKRFFQIPVKRAFEAVYLIPTKLTDAEFEALEEKAESDALLSMEPDEAFQYYYANQDDYDLKPIRDRLRREWEASQPRDEEKEGAEKEGAEGAEKEGAEDAEKEGAEEENAGKDDAGEAKDGAGDEGDPGDPGQDGEPGAADETGAPADPEKTDPEKTDPEKTDPEKTDPEKADPEPEPEKPVWKDPTLEMKPIELYQTYFRERVERELFVKRFLARILKDEQIDRKGLPELAKEYGLTLVATPEPLDQVDLLELDGIGGEPLRRALTRFDAGREGEYSDEILFAERGEDRERAWLFFRVTTVVAEHFPDLTDEVDAKTARNTVWRPGISYNELEDISAREVLVKAFPDATIAEDAKITVEAVLRQLLRRARAEDAANAKLETLRDIVVGGDQTFAGAAKERGFTVVSLRGVTKETPVPPEITPEDGKELTPEQVRTNLERDRRRFLLKGSVPGQMSNLDRMNQTPAGDFLAEVLTDKLTDAAYLVRVVSHTVPGAEEMPELEATMLTFQMSDGERRGRLKEFFRFENLMDLYQIEVPGITDVEEEKAGKAGN